MPTPRVARDHRPVDRAEKLLRVAGAASIVFTIGTALHAFVIVNEHTLTRMMLLAGADPAGADRFLTIFRVVGCLYLAGNAIGILALRGEPHPWLFWTLLAVNATQAAGVFVVPPQMWQAAGEEFGLAGVLPSLVTDGGALVLTIALVTAAVKDVRERKKPAQRG
jgi:hypothetical protein